MAKTNSTAIEAPAISMDAKRGSRFMAALLQISSSINSLASTAPLYDENKHEPGEVNPAFLVRATHSTVEPIINLMLAMLNGEDEVIDDKTLPPKLHAAKFAESNDSLQEAG